MSESIKNEYSTTASCYQNKKNNTSTNFGLNRQNLSFPISGASVPVAVCASSGIKKTDYIRGKCQLEQR